MFPTTTTTQPPPPPSWSAKESRHLLLHNQEPLAEYSSLHANVAREDCVKKERNKTWDLGLLLLLLLLLLLPLGSGRRHIDFLTSAAASTSLLRTSLPNAPPSYMSSAFCQMFSSLINFVIFRSHLPPSCFCPSRQATPFVKFSPVFCHLLQLISYPDLNKYVLSP